MTASRPTQDRVLILRAMHGERNGATRLVAKYGRLVKSHLTRCVKDADHAEDLVQESFLTAFRNLARLRDLEQFKSWLMRIAHRSFLAYLRSPTPAHETVSGEFQLPEVMADAEVADPLEFLTRNKNIRAIVEELPDPFRTTLDQRYYEDLPIAEVARRQSIDIPLAKYRIRHGLELLKRKLAAVGITERDI